MGRQAGGEGCSAGHMGRQAGGEGGSGRQEVRGGQEGRR